MPQAEGNLIQLLKQLRNEFSTLNPDQTEGLVPIGIKLEQLTTELPAEFAAAADLLMHCLGGLQKLFEGQAADPAALTQAIAGALVSAEQFLIAPQNAVWEQMVAQASGLAGLLADDANAETPASAESAAGSASQLPEDLALETDSSPEPATTLSLDEIATLLAQLDPSDQTELAALARAHQALLALAAEVNCPPTAHKLMTEAARTLEALAQNTADDPQPLLAQIGRLIEDAAWALDESAPQHHETARQSETSEPRAALSLIEMEFELPFEGELDTPLPAATAPPSINAAHQKNAATQEFDALPPDADLNLLGELITENREYIEGAEGALLSLETDPDNLEAVNTVFRAFHTIKGTAAFLGLTSICELAHLAESLLSRVRDHEIRYSGGYADLSLRSVDMLKELIQSVQDAVNGHPMLRPAGYGELMRLLTNPEAAGITGEAGETDPAPLRMGDILVGQDKVDRETMNAIAETRGDNLLGEALLKAQASTVTDVAQALRLQQRLNAPKPQEESSVRVRTDRLDGLINMIGELVIAQSMVAQDPTARHALNHEMLRKITHTGKIVRELQNLSMSMRMVPLKATFQKIARLVRDLAQKSGKLATFVTEGEETEIDRNMVDVINDPLVHMIRNALDHGIEAPDLREQRGKSRTGTVHLSAYHSGGNVVLQMKDDGKGLDRERIVQKAISKGLISADHTLSDSEVFNLIFEPGFSTAEQVTDLSGRGVGMDVVRQRVEALRGRVNITSVAGQGTTFTMLLPLTLAITDGMLVKVGQERYIIPTVSIHLTFRPEANALSTIAGRGEMVMLRDELMPIFRLHRLFNVAGAGEDPTTALLIVVGDGDRRCALLVDELLGQHQVVAKSLGNGIGKVPGVSGGAILGDGCVGLILDAPEIAALARQTSAPYQHGETISKSAA